MSNTYILHCTKAIFIQKYVFTPTNQTLVQPHSSPHTSNPFAVAGPLLNQSTYLLRKKQQPTYQPNNQTNTPPPPKKKHNILHGVALTGMVRPCRSNHFSEQKLNMHKRKCVKQKHTNVSNLGGRDKTVKDQNDLKRHI